MMTSVLMLTLAAVTSACRRRSVPHVSVLVAWNWMAAKPVLVSSRPNFFLILLACTRGTEAVKLYSLLWLSCVVYVHIVNMICYQNVLISRCICGNFYVYLISVLCYLLYFVLDKDECRDPGVCSQLCVDVKHSYKCQCDAGYTLMPDHRTCRVNSQLFACFNKSVMKNRLLDITQTQVFTVVAPLYLQTTCQTPLRGHWLRTCCTTPPTDKLTTILQLVVQQICHIAMPQPNVSTCQDVWTSLWCFCWNLFLEISELTPLYCSISRRCRLVQWSDVLCVLVRYWQAFHSGRNATEFYEGAHGQDGSGGLEDVTGQYRRSWYSSVYSRRKPADGLLGGLILKQDMELKTHW